MTYIDDRSKFQFATRDGQRLVDLCQSNWSIKMKVKIIRPQGNKTFLNSTQLSRKYHARKINVKMPTIVGILIFINRINTTCKCFKQKNVLFFSEFYFLSIRAVEISCSAELGMIKIS